MSLPRFMIAAPASGSGKTLITCGLLQALVDRGLSVASFKCGPDYIDPMFHSRVIGARSKNLDAYFVDAPTLRYLFGRTAEQCDVSVVEGVMGFYDGVDFTGTDASSYDVSEKLDIPVVLIVNSRGASLSTLAVLKGFKEFRPNRIAGVIFNKVGSPRHADMLQEACADVGIPCFGYLLKDKELEQQSRYLGLDFSQEGKELAVDEWVERIERHIDISHLLQVLLRPLGKDENPFDKHPYRNLHTVVLRDAESFSFIYTEHLDILRRIGQVTFLNPEEDMPLPSDTDLLYLPGGYPEKHAVRLSKAKCCMESIRDYIEQGGRALAECGGMIYLSRGIWLEEDPTFVPLCGTLPFVISCRKEERKLSLGYRRFRYQGLTLRGHEFHYSQFREEGNVSLASSVAQVYDARGQEVSTPVFRHKNLIASYTHLYWGEIDILQLF